jgi:hypothetical protein
MLTSWVWALDAELRIGKCIELFMVSPKMEEEVATHKYILYMWRRFSFLFLRHQRLGLWRSKRLMCSSRGHLFTVPVHCCHRSSGCAGIRTKLKAKQKWFVQDGMEEGGEELEYLPATWVSTSVSSCCGSPCVVLPTTLLLHLVSKITSLSKGRQWEIVQSSTQITFTIESPADHPLM